MVRSRMPGGQNIAKTFKPESIYATEIGSKNEFLNRKLVANCVEAVETLDETAASPGASDQASEEGGTQESNVDRPSES